MTERPISLPGPMVRAILEGRKTQTRRVITHRHGIRFHGGAGERGDPSCWGWSFDGPHHSGYAVLARGLNERHDNGLVSMPCPYGEVGDRLWVRETWAVQHDLDPLKPSEMDPKIARLHYSATEERGGLLWRSPLFMPRWASRITLEITDVRVQRLQEIGEEDAKAEGCREFFEEFPQIGRDQRLTCGALASDAPYRASFAVLWDSINARRAPWASNPWVWAISFERLP